MFNACPSRYCELNGGHALPFPNIPNFLNENPLIKRETARVASEYMLYCTEFSLCSYFHSCPASPLSRLGTLVEKPEHWPNARSCQELSHGDHATCNDTNNSGC